MQDDEKQVKKTMMIDFDNSIKVLFIDDGVVLDLHEFAATNSCLDKVYTCLKEYSPNKVIVITHSNITSCLSKDSCVAFSVITPARELLGLLNTQEISKIIDVIDKAGVNDLAFVDKLGYYLECGTKDVCYVEDYLGIKRMLCLSTNSIGDYAIATETGFNDRLDKFMKANNLTTVCNERELTDIPIVMCFVNSAMSLDEEQTLHDLSVFAYAYLAVDTESPFVYDTSVLERTVERIQSVENEPISAISEEYAENDIVNDDDESESVTADEIGQPTILSKSENKKTLNMTKCQKQFSIENTISGDNIPMESKKLKKSESLSSVLVVAGVAGLAVTTLLTVYTNTLQNNSVESAQLAYYSAQSENKSAKNVNDSYRMFSELTEPEAITILEENLQQLEQNGGSLNSFDYTNASNVDVYVTFDNEDAYNKFVDNNNLDTIQYHVTYANTDANADLTNTSEEQEQNVDESNTDESVE